MAMRYSFPTSANTGDEPSGIEYEDWKNTLLQCLEGIGSFCEIASSSRYTMFPNPGLEIEGHPAFPLPLTSAHAQLIKNACRPASSSREANTPVDTPVQNIWELNRRQFRLLNPEWDVFLKEVATEAAHSLGLTDVGLMLHKLLLHEKGFSSQNYGDIEESPGKIGTLFICLPSEHSGGDVHISFGPDKHHFITAPTSKHDLTASAWYSDVSHKTKEIKSGYRLALTYSIFQRGSDKKSAALVGQPTHMIRKHLLEWQTRFPDKETLIRPLDHSYSEAELSISHMKGYDRDVCRALHSVASECGVYLFFAHLRPVNSGPGRHGYNVDERDTHAIHRTMYSPNGKPIGFGYTPKPEEMLGLEGDLDNDDERSFTEEEDVEDASDYYRTAAFLVKKKSAHRYMSHISPNSPSGYSFANTNTENMVEMVVDDMRDFMKNQDMGEHARPPILEVLRKALGPNESSRVLTPVVVKWALKLKNMGLYQSAMMAAAKSGIEDILESAIKTACGFVEHHFGDVPGHIDWDKWMENVAPMDTVIDVHVTIQNFTSAFKKDAVRDSFVKWGDSKLTDKLDTQASFEISEWPFFIVILGGRHSKRDWLKARLITALASSGTRELLYGVLNTVLFWRSHEEYPVAELLFEQVFNRSFGRLLLHGADLRPKSAGPGSLTCGPPTRCVPPCRGPLKDFAKIVGQIMHLGLASEGIELLEASCDSILRTKATWCHKKLGGDVTTELLVPLIEIFKEHNIPVTQGAKSLFEVVLREGLYENIPPNPPEPRRWAHRSRTCSKGRDGQGPNCRDCEAMDAFLIAPDQRVWKYQAEKPIHDHLKSQLRAGGDGSSDGARYFNISTERTQRAHTMVVEKTGREFLDEVESWKESVWALEARLAPLRDEMVAGMLGSRTYRELVLVEDLRAQIVTSGSSITTGVKREVDGSAIPELYSVKRARL